METPLMRLSPVALRQYLNDRSAALALQIARQDRVPMEEAEGRVKGLCEVLGLLDRVEITQRSTSDQFHIRLRIRVTLPLRKQHR
jgi:hypothetical protein